MADSENNREEDEKDPDEKIAEALSGVVVMEKPNVKFEEVAGLEEAKEALEMAVILRIKFPDLYKGVRSCGGILLYGLPGTGKSLFAKAVATEANNSTFFSFSAAEINSLSIIEGQKFVKNLFQVAHESKPSIIFIDEVDLLYGYGGEGKTDEGRRRITTEILMQIQDLSSNNGIFVLGSTCYPLNLDPKIRRNFEKRVYIPLPETKARSHMFKIRLGSVPNSLTDEDFEGLGQSSEGYTGADIVCVVSDAQMHPVRKIQKATHFKKVRGPSHADSNVLVDDLFTPCLPSDPGAIEMSFVDIPEHKHLEMVVSYADVNLSLQNQKPSMTEKDLENLTIFTNEFVKDV